MRSATVFDNYTLYEDGTLLKNSGQAVKWYLSHKGYPQISCTDKDGKKHGKTLHRLLAETFIPNPEGLSDVNHIDCDRANFALSNLEWMTHGENIKYSYDMGRRSALGTNNARCITEEQTVIEICELLQKGFGAAEIRDMGYLYSRVRSIRRRQNWRHISDNYSW